MPTEVASLFGSLDLRDNMTAGLRRAEGSFDGFSGRIRSGVGGLVSALAPLAAGIGAAFGGAKAVDAALTFDRSMANIRAVTGKTAEEMRGLSAEILKVGRNSIAGPQAVADAFYDIVGGVADASTHMAILDAAIATSEAGQAALATTTSGLISVMNAYNFEADKASLVSDVFTKTVGMGVGTMDEFVGAMSPVAGTLSQAGVSFEDFGAMMAYMTTKGVNASMSATQLRQATIALLNPNQKMRDGLRQAGIESASMALKQRGLAGVLGQLQVAVGGNVEEMAAMMGSAEALNAALIINQPGFESFLGTFQDTMTGATEAARKLQLDSVSAQFDLLKASLEGAAIDIGTAVLPIINKVIETGGTIKAEIEKWFSTSDIGIAISQIGAGLQPALDGLINTISGLFSTEPQLPMYLVTPDGFQLIERPTLVDAVGDLIDSLATEISRVGQTVLDEINKLVSGLDVPQPVKDIVDGLLWPLHNVFENLEKINWNNMLEVGIVIGGIGLGVGLLGPAVRLFASVEGVNLLTTFLRELSNMWTALKEGDWRTFLESLAVGITALAGAVIAFDIAGGGGGVRAFLGGLTGMSLGGAVTGAAGGAVAGWLGRNAGNLIKGVGAALLTPEALAVAAGAVVAGGAFKLALDHANAPTFGKAYQPGGVRDTVAGYMMPGTGNEIGDFYRVGDTFMDSFERWRETQYAMGGPRVGRTRSKEEAAAATLTGTDLPNFTKALEGFNAAVAEAKIMEPADRIVLEKLAVMGIIPADRVTSLKEAGIKFDSTLQTLINTGIHLDETQLTVLRTMGIGPDTELLNIALVGFPAAPDLKAIYENGIRLQMGEMPLPLGNYNPPVPLGTAAARAARSTAVVQFGQGSAGGGSMPISRPGRAFGGPVVAGRRYRVGEYGPETFVPSQNGTVLPNGGGGETVIHNVIQLDSKVVYDGVIKERDRRNRRGW